MDKIRAVLLFAIILLVLMAGCNSTINREITQGDVTPGPTGPTGAAVVEPGPEEVPEELPEEEPEEPIVIPETPEEEPQEEPEENETLPHPLPPGLHYIDYPEVRLGDIEIRDRGAKKISDTESLFEVLILNYGTEKAAVKVYTYVYFQSNIVGTYKTIIKDIKPGKAKYNYTINYTSYWNAFTLALENP